MNMPLPDFVKFLKSIRRRKRKNRIPVYFERRQLFLSQDEMAIAVENKVFFYTGHIYIIALNEIPCIF